MCSTREFIKSFKTSRLVIYFITSIVFILLFSSSTSPIYDIPFASDSAMFQTIGKYWAEGSLPYVDLWDSKGPLIFAVNALGYMLIGQRWGIAIIQIICIFITLVIVDRILSRYVSGKRLTLFTFIFLGAYLLVYASNCTEEYVLPLITASLYGFSVYIDNVESKNYIHNPFWAFIYGLTFSACFLTRLTNALGICGGVFVIMCTLIAHKHFKNLFMNAIMFIAGFTVLTLPFVVYFYCNGAFNDFLYGTFTYNLGYAGNSNFNIFDKSFLEALSVILAFFNGLFLSIVGVLILFIRKKPTSGFMYIFIGLLPFIWLINSNGYLHYGIITISYSALIVSAVCKEFFDKKSRISNNRIIHIVCLSIFLSQSIISSLIGIKNSASGIYNALFIHEVQEYKKAESELINLIPVTDRDSFIAYNTNPGIYLQMDIKPCYPYFTMQDWAISCNETLGELVTEEYSSCKAKWILVEDNGSKLRIDDILNEKYVLAAEKDKPFGSNAYKLYKLK